MKRLVFLVALIISCLSACGNESLTREKLEQLGYTKIRIDGWVPFVCSDDDTWSTGFNALTPDKKRVSGVMCCGMVLKACTIRY